MGWIFAGVILLSLAILPPWNTTAWSNSKRKEKTTN